MFFVEFLDRQNRGDLLAFLERKKIDDRPAARGALAFRRLINLEPVHPAAAGEAQDVVVGVGDEQAIDEIILLDRCRLFAASAAALGAVVGQRLALDVAGVRQRDDHVLAHDQVFEVDVGGAQNDFRTPRIAELDLHRLQFLADDGSDALGAGQDVEQVGDLLHHLLVLGNDLVLFQPRQALQAQFEDGLSLGIGQQITLHREAELRAQAVGARGFGRGAGQHVFHQGRAPGARHQAALGFGRRLGGLDQGDDFIDVRQGDRQAFEDVAALARLAQFEHRAPRDDLAPVGEEALQHVFQVEQSRPAIDQRHHVHAEGVLQLGLLVEVVQHHLGHLAFFQLDHQAHARLVRLVLDMGDAVDLLLVDQFGDLFLQGLLVDLVGQLIDHDGLPSAARQILYVGARAHDHAAATGQVAVAHAGNAVNQSGRREIRRRDDGDQFFDRRLGLAKQGQAGIDHLIEVVRRDVGRHAHGDAGGTVVQQIRDARRQDQRFLLGTVVVGPEIDGFLVDVEQQFMADARHAHFRVAHRRRVVAIHRAEVALAVDQHVAQRKILRHAHDGVVHRRIAVRVVLADHVADDARRLLVGLVPVVGKLVHGEKHAPMHGFQAIAHVRQRPADDHAHGVVEVRVTHLLFEADRQGFFGERCHLGGFNRLAADDGVKGCNFSMRG